MATAMKKDKRLQILVRLDPAREVWMQKAARKARVTSIIREALRRAWPVKGDENSLDEQACRGLR